MQTLRARCRWVPHERMVVDASRWSPVNRGRRSRAMRNVYRETHKRNLRPHQQMEQAQTGEYDPRNAGGCSHTIKADGVSGGDP